MSLTPLEQRLLSEALRANARPAPMPFQLVDFEGVTPETWISLGCASEWRFAAVMARREAAERQARADRSAERAYLRHQAARAAA